ncbi:MAG TPA: endonuclease/exonuclease/phosphatase family protein [Polyangiaceae bacterium]|nr:endonuclease/exonuclease/phosphatase family protein [Polyangiaceae bacterium]
MTLTLATFNVKDYFESPRNLPVLAAKAEEIAAQLTRADADVIALQEVGSEPLLRDVLARMPGASYEIVFGGADRRGIGNAILARVPLLERDVLRAEALPFPVFRRGDAAPFAGRLPLRRAVVRVALRALGLPIHVFCTHWKSKLPKAEEDEAGAELAWTTGRERAEADLRSLVSRSAEALFVRAAVERSAAAGAEVVLMGDLNDTLDSVPVRIVLGSGVEPALHAAASRAPASARVSTLHRGEPEQIDHILHTQRLQARLTSVAFFNEGLRDHPFGEAEPTIDSDHALVCARYG